MVNINDLSQDVVIVRRR